MVFFLTLKVLVEETKVGVHLSYLAHFIWKIRIGQEEDGNGWGQDLVLKKVFRGQRKMNYGPKREKRNSNSTYKLYILMCRNYPDELWISKYLFLK